MACGILINPRFSLYKYSWKYHIECYQSGFPSLLPRPYFCLSTYPVTVTSVATGLLPVGIKKGKSSICFGMGFNVNLLQ
jgi:hypothetical protein